eukprot:TRINITY_DN9581_c0_g1_i1.p1 TRINITY_DN9581_c0_g1~~TRINITY_DN9581_c0_g1_i1.p1  ORF type:complete len:287 (+),score=79.44 TRINITY_DN9581_c0_g1_i1:907-1767(+)
MSNDMNELSNEEQIRYDRQMRLWGKDVQRSIKNGKIAVIFDSSSVDELIKNVVLMGFGEIVLFSTLLNKDVKSFYKSSVDDSNQLFSEALVEEFSQMNHTIKICSKIFDLSTFNPLEFDCIVYNGSNTDELIILNDSCHLCKRPFIAVNCTMNHGYIFIDCAEHQYKYTQEIKNKEETTKINYVGFVEGFTLKNIDNIELSRNLSSKQEFNIVLSVILGAQVCNQIVALVSHFGIPIVDLQTISLNPKRNISVKRYIQSKNDYFILENQLNEGMEDEFDYAEVISD